VTPFIADCADHRRLESDGAESPPWAG